MTDLIPFINLGLPIELALLIRQHRRENFHKNVIDPFHKKIYNTLRMETLLYRVRYGELNVTDIENDLLELSMKVDRIVNDRRNNPMIIIF